LPVALTIFWNAVTAPGLLPGYAGLTDPEIRDGVRVLASIIGRRRAPRQERKLVMNARMSGRSTR
jgi:hypothetical protein